MRRVLLTGSRNWSDREAIRTVLRAEIYRGGLFLLVHGDCPTGADRVADEEYRAMGGVTERHPADWGTHGKAAGPLRNQAMVDLGADLCLAFPLGASRGTRDCMRRATAAGIPVRDCTTSA